MSWILDLLGGVANSLMWTEALGWTHLSRGFYRWFFRVFTLVMALAVLPLGFFVVAAAGEASGYVFGGIVLALAGALIALTWGGWLGLIVVTLMGLACAAFAVSSDPVASVVIVGSILAGYGITRPMAALFAKEVENAGIWEASRASPSTPVVPKPNPAHPSGPAWRVIWGRGLPGVVQGGSVSLSIESGQLVVAKSGHGRAAAFPIGRVRLEQLAGGNYLLSADGDEIAVLEPIDADPAALIAALRAGTRPHQ